LATVTYTEDKDKGFLSLVVNLRGLDEFLAHERRGHLGRFGDEVVTESVNDILGRVVGSDGTKYWLSSGDLERRNADFTTVHVGGLERMKGVVGQGCWFSITMVAPRPIHWHGHRGSGHLQTVAAEIRRLFWDGEEIDGTHDSEISNLTANRDKTGVNKRRFEDKSTT
jgi:hypothetical protein